MSGWYWTGDSSGGTTYVLVCGDWPVLVLAAYLSEWTRRWAMIVRTRDTFMSLTRVGVYNASNSLTF